MINTISSHFIEQTHSSTKPSFVKNSQPWGSAITATNVNSLMVATNWSGYPRVNISERKDAQSTGQVASVLMDWDANSVTVTLSMNLLHSWQPWMHCKASQPRARVLGWWNCLNTDIYLIFHFFFFFVFFTVSNI